MPSLARYGITGYVNYALGRVRFRNPVTGGFVTEAAHVTDTREFLAPMDQTQTLTAGATCRHGPSGAWLATVAEYGSGTPMGHDDAGHEHADGEADHAHAATGSALRVPAHLLLSASVGLDLLADARGRKRLTLRLDAENVANRSHLLAQEGQFSPAQYSIPRVVSATVRVRF